MSKLKFELNIKGVRELLRSEAMKAILTDKAGAALSRLGEGYNIDDRTMKFRARAVVYAETAEAKKDSYKNNSILKAVH